MNFTLNAIWFSLATILITTGVTNAQWHTDVEKGAQEALKDGKDVLLLFTGETWCPPCQKLKSEILTADGFVSEISGDFVLIKLDFPQDSDPACLLYTSPSPRD